MSTEPDDLAALAAELDGILASKYTPASQGLMIYELRGRILAALKQARDAKAMLDRIRTETGEVQHIRHEDCVGCGCMSLTPEEAVAKVIVERDRLRQQVAVLRPGLEAVLACEMCHDERGHAYLKVLSRSIFDPPAQLRDLLARTAPPEGK